MKYLVCRLDAVRPNGHMRTSHFFPMVVDVEDSSLYKTNNDEFIVRKALDTISQGYVGKYEYIVVPLDQARVVSFKPIPQPSYMVETRDYIEY